VSSESGESKGSPDRSVRCTHRVGFVLQSTGPFQIRLVVSDLVACVSWHGYYSTCNRGPLDYCSNCCALRAVGYDFFFALPLVTSSPA
jgi:hypothetical protein